MIARFAAKCGLTLLAVVCLVGCGSETQPDHRLDSSDLRAASFRDLAADQFLAAVFTRYRNASQYHDSAVVRLSYESEGRLIRQMAPLSVWFHRDRLYVKSYDVRLWSAQNSLTAWIADPTTRKFDSQVLKTTGQPDASVARSLDRPNLQTLFADPILAQRLGAGLAGPPPQLEWLFAAEPMKHLFAAENRFEYGPSPVDSDHADVLVHVFAAGDRYRFWIDRQQGLIRRVDLPPAQDPATGQTITLSLDLAAASFTAPDDPQLDPLPESPRYVRKFVPLPPEKPPQVLGTRSGRFRLTATDSSFTLTQRGSDRNVTLLLRCSGDPHSIAATAVLQEWVVNMPQAVRNQVRAAIVVDDPRSIPRRLNLPAIVDRDGVLRSGFQMTPGSLVLLQSDGKVAWAQPRLDPGDLVTLGALLGDVLAGVDVPRRLRDQWNANFDAYRASLIKQQIRPK